MPAARPAVFALLAATLPCQSPEQSARIDALFGRWTRPDSPGAAVLVLHGGRVVHRRGYGMADLEHSVPIAPDTVFDVASVSKQFCGLAIAMLAEQEKIDVTDDIRRHIDWVPAFDGREITIAHLVHHTSGLRDWPGTLQLAGWRYDDVITFAQILKMVRHQRDLDFDPGTRHSYSNTGYNLLAHLVEKLSGVSFAAWTRAQLFDPLGMRDTHFHDDHTRVVPKRATAYRRAGGTWTRVTDNLTAVGSSSLFTTLDDLGKWMLNFEAQKVGGAAAHARMHQRGALADGSAVDYCYGVWWGRHRGLQTVGHTGSWAGFKTCTVRYPAARFAVVVLANTDTIVPTQMAEAIAAVCLADGLEPAPDRGGRASAAARPAPPPAAQPATRLAAFAGRYRSAELDTAYDIEVAEPGLRMRHFRNADVSLRAAPGRDAFRGNATWAQRVAFVRDGDGGVTAMLVSGSRFRDVRFDRQR